MTVNITLEKRIRDLPNDIQYVVLYYLCYRVALNKAIRICTMFCKVKDHQHWIRDVMNSRYELVSKMYMVVHLCIITSRVNVNDNFMKSFMSIFDFSYTKYANVLSSEVMDIVLYKIRRVLVNPNSNIITIHETMLEQILQREDTDMHTVAQNILKTGKIHLIKLIPVKYLGNVDIVEHIQRSNRITINELNAILWHNLPTRSLNLLFETYQQLVPYYSLDPEVLQRLGRHPNFDVEEFRFAYRVAEQLGSTRRVITTLQHGTGLRV